MERYVLRGGQWGYDRLKLLARIKRDDTLELLLRAGIRPGMRCLDLGCGGGEVTFDLAAAAGPEGSVIGVDMDAEKLALARESARERGIGEILVSISHCRTYATAYALAIGRPSGCPQPVDPIAQS